jgi:hypothetical protein
MAKREIIIHASGDGNEWTASIYIDGKRFSGIAALPAWQRVRLAAS